MPGAAPSGTTPGGTTPVSGLAARPRLDHGLGLAVIAGLADDVQISETAGGVSIRMSWPALGLRP